MNPHATPGNVFHRIRGMSLIELMVALVLGLLLIAGVIQLFLGSRMTYSSGEAMARVQENGRFAIEMLKAPARQAASRGFCGGEIPIRNHLRQNCSGYVNHIFDPAMSISGWTFTDTDTAPGEEYDADSLDPEGLARGQWSVRDQSGDTQGLPEELQDRVVPGTDVLVVRWLEVVPEITALGNTQANSASINLVIPDGADGSGIMQDEIILVTNCNDGADIFQNRNVATASAVASGSGDCDNPGPGNHSMNWSTRYEDSAQFFRPKVNAYYIGFNSDRNEPGLYRLDLSQGTAAAQAEELVSGVEHMQILFGYSFPGDAGGDGQSVDHWVTATQVPDWKLVTAVHIAISVRSPENAGPEEVVRTFDLAGTQVTFNVDQRRLRHSFQTTVGIRNRYIVM